MACASSSPRLALFKLMFPNEYHVYLHSTPATELFSRTRRVFSARCIRVEKLAELATWVLRNNPGWTLERVQQEMENGKDNVTVSLARRVPVFIIYGTAIAYENNEVHFYDEYRMVMTQDSPRRWRRGIVSIERGILVVEKSFLWVQAITSIGKDKRHEIPESYIAGDTLAVGGGHGRS